MAKKFNEIFVEANETVYSKKANIMTILAMNNPMVSVSPILKPGGKLDGTTTKWNVQRRKRPSISVVANANTGSTAAALAVLDSFSTADWETLPIATGVLHSIGFKKIFKDDYDFSNDPQHKKDLMYMVGEVATQRKKDLNTLLKTAAKTGVALPAYAEGKTLVWDAIVDLLIAVAQVDDEYKDVQDITDLIGVISPLVAKDLTKEMGTVFNQERPIAGTGFKSGQQVYDAPFLVEPRFTGREVIVQHVEAIGLKKEEVDKNIAVDLGITQYTGKVFFDVMTIIDTARIKQIGA